MSASDHRLAHFRAIVEAEARAAGGTGKQHYRAAYKAVAANAGLSEEYVYQLFKGKSNKGKIGDEAAAKLDRKYAEGRERGWIDMPLNMTSRHTAAEDTPDYSLEPIRPPTIEEAVNRLAELLSSLDDDGRAHASTALSNLAKNPERGASKAAEMLLTLEHIHPREPTPDPTSPTPSRAGESAAAAARAAGRARLTVKTGGGQKMQLGLPFKTVANPWDKSMAPDNERRWYDRVKAAPKAATRTRTTKERRK